MRVKQRIRTFIDETFSVSYLEVRLFQRWDNLSVIDRRKPSKDVARCRIGKSTDTTIPVDKLANARMPTSKLVVDGNGVTDRKGPRGSSSPEVGLLLATAENHSILDWIVDPSKLNMLFTDHERVAGTIRDISYPSHGKHVVRIHY